MAEHLTRVISWWRRFIRHSFDGLRLEGGTNAATVRRRGLLVERLGFEWLEDRRLLAVDPTSLYADFASLEIDRLSYDPSHLLVRFDETVTNASDYLRAAVDVALQSVETATALPLVSGLQKVGFGADFSFSAALEALRQDPHVLYAEPDYRVRATGLSTDPLFADQWDLHNVGQTGGTLDSDMDAPEAWDASTGTGSTIVAVIDTGVDFLHPDLASNMWVNQDEIPGNGIDDDNNGYVDDIHGYDFYNNDGNPRDDHDHGTHVAGTIGAVGNNGVGVAGVNWNVQIMALKFLGSDGSGTTSDAIEAIRYAVDNGAHISNNSWGGDPYSQALYDAIRDARDAGHIFVAAAGNGNFLGFGINNDNTPFYPAGYDLDNIVAVAATDHNDQQAVFSNYGLTTVDLGAPGVSILSTTRNNSYGLNSGTSMATPHVTGALSLVRDFAPGLTYRQIIDRVLGSVDPVSSLEGLTVTGGRLNVASALIPDTFGPQIAGIDPSGLTLDPMNSVRIVFDEAIDASTFTLADIVRFTGPNGEMSPLSLGAVAGTNDRQFSLGFPLQSAPGEYELEISPNIVDRFGNVMDQDNDGIGGEPFEDRFLGQFRLADTVARFDFGTSTSPVAEGYTGVTRYDRYDSAVGYGWHLGSSADISRGTGTDLTRDVNFTHDATFSVDLANGEYDVIATLGDTSLAHDLVGVFLEGAQVDTVTTAGGQTVTKTYRVTVADGQLNLRLADLGGSDYWAMINGLDVVYVGPDTTGPQVVAADPAVTATGPVDRIRLTFSEVMNQSSFTLADVVVLEGPSGAITPTAVNSLGGGEFEVVFAPQNVSGGYRLEIGPDIADASGNLLDQDGDGIGGETLGDHYTTTFTLQAGPNYVARFDFGTSTSPVAEGYTGVTRYDRYDSAVGYGWHLGSSADISRGTGTDLTRDVNFTHDATFSVELANGEYDVIATLGDTSLAHDLVGVFLEGAQVDTVTTAGGQTVTKTYRVTVADGQLNLRLADLGGSDYWAMINGLDVVYVGPDTTGPQVVAADPAVTATGPVDRIRLTFSEVMNQSSFTLADVVVLEGPSGAITPTAVNSLGGGEFEVVFAPQNVSGGYRLEIGPDIADASGNLLDQDGDGIGGETLGDHYTTTFTLQAGPNYVARFDFGTSTSPVAEGYTGVTRYDRYDSAVGYGWHLGSSADISRGTGTDLTRDVNFTHDATFSVDLANGEYDVIATLGDTSLAHDLVGVFLEGAQVDTVTTAGGQTVTKTYRVTVADGQLNLRLADLGGSDYWAMINGLELIQIEGGIQSAGSNTGIAADRAPVQSSDTRSGIAKSAFQRALRDRELAIGGDNDLLRLAEWMAERIVRRTASTHDARDQAFSKSFDKSTRRDSDESITARDSLDLAFESFSAGLEIV